MMKNSSQSSLTRSFNFCFTILATLLLAKSASALTSNQHPLLEKNPKTPVFADLALLNAAGIRAITVESSTQVGYAEITNHEQSMLSQKAHEWNRCGGYEDLSLVFGSPSPTNHLAPTQNASPGRSNLAADHRMSEINLALRDLAIRQSKDQQYEFSHRLTSVPPIAMRAEVKAAVEQVSEQNIKDTVAFYSAFHTRYNKGATPNEAPEALKVRIETLLKTSKIPYTIEFISHQSTQQKSVHVRLIGKLRPNEIVVLGGHLDSINVSWFGNDAAPGADDNASGTADLIEALRIVIGMEQPERTLDFFWYAGEESGLLGSAEIAKTYKSAKSDVIGVMQLDMTLHPGAGEFVLGSMTDFTSSWMRSYLTDLNTLYIHAKVVEDKCGYGCSDHASWYRQGYPTLMPFEATFNTMNPNLHTANDIVNAKSDFAHSAMFAKIAVAIAEDLGNSNEREP